MKIVYLYKGKDIITEEEYAKVDLPEKEKEILYSRYALYTKEELENMGFPKNESLLELNGQIYKLKGAKGIEAEVLTEIGGKRWFGKVALIMGKGPVDGYAKFDMSVLNFETGEIVATTDNTRYDDLMPITDQVFLARYKGSTWGRAILGKNNALLDYTDGEYGFMCDKEGNLLNIERWTGRGIVNLKKDADISLEALAKRARYHELAAQIVTALEEMKEMGVNRKNVEMILDGVYGKKQDKEK